MRTEPRDFELLRNRLDDAQEHLDTLLLTAIIHGPIPGFEETAAVVQARHAVEEAQYDLDCAKNDW